MTSSRRSFLQSSATLAAGVAAGTLAVSRSAHAAGSDLIKVGLVGCGGRGTGAAVNALSSDANIQLTAMADVFEDRLADSLKSLEKNQKINSKLAVTPERRFTGFDGYKQLLASGVDVVLLATPPHFRPAHLRAAIDADKHVFAEKPVAVDAPGVQSVLDTCELAKKKGLCVVSGLCLRYHYGFKDLVNRVHDGAIGKIHTLQANDYRGTIWQKPREPDWTDMHYQMRNWYYYTWLSGDFNVEQHVHFLDVCAWLMGNRYPVSAVGMGGREVRRGEEFGNIFDHHGVVYEFEDGAKLFSNTRQIKGCWNQMNASAVGDRGRCQLIEKEGGIVIDAEKKWVYTGEDNNIYDTEHEELYAAIRAGKTINNGEYMSKSTLLAILGRMATYTGQKITWKQAWESKQVLGPKEYKWGPAPEVEIAVPGVTKFV